MARRKCALVGLAVLIVFALRAQGKRLRAIPSIFRFALPRQAVPGDNTECVAALFEARTV